MKEKIFRIVFIVILTIGSGILSFSEEGTGVKISNINVSISTQKAKEIVFSHSKVNKSAARITKLMLYKENRKYFYDIEFFTAAKKYIYRVDANTGNIMEYKQQERTKKQNEGFKISVFGL